MKVITIDDINLDSLELYHTNKNHYNSKIYYKNNIFTTIFNKPLELYNMFISNEEYISYFCPALICLIIEGNKLKGYQMKEGRIVRQLRCINYIEKNKKKLI